MLQKDGNMIFKPAYDYIIIGAGQRRQRAGRAAHGRRQRFRCCCLKPGLPDYRLDFRTQMPSRAGHALARHHL